MADRNMVRLEASEPGQQIEEMLAAIMWCASRGFDPIWDVQVLTAVNAKSELSRKNLNKLLQAELNNEENSGHVFRVGDKIVNTKNGTFKIANSNTKSMYAANGDIAQVVEIEAKHLLATLVVGNETIMIPKGRVFQQDVDADGDPDPNEKEQPNTGCSWDLAYALSVHKSQGSEFPVCIVMLDTYPGAMRISSREWLYTATSRGKKLQIEIGLGDTTDRMVRRVALGKRKTLLAEQINHIQCERLVGEL